MKDNNLAKKIQNLSPVLLSEGEIEEAGIRFIGVFDCLIKMWSELKNEGCYFDESEFQGTRRRAQLECPKYTPYRICETKKYPDY